MGVYARDNDSKCTENNGSFFLFSLSNNDIDDDPS